jgi:hypothetical protein
MLAIRIVKANYTPIPKRYSSKMALLIKKLLNPNTEARPTINKILKIDIITNRAKELLNEDDYIQEFSHTVLHNKNIFKQVDHNYDSSDQQDEETIFTKQAKKSQDNKASNNTDYDTITDTELFNQDPLQYVNNVIGGLEEK